MQEPCENRFCSLLLFEVQEINRFLEICHRDPRKILRASRYSKVEPRHSILDSFEDRVSSRDCQLTFARYCRSNLFMCLRSRTHFVKASINLTRNATYLSNTTVQQSTPNAMQEHETRLPLETKEMNISICFRKIPNASNSSFKRKQRNLPDNSPHSKEAQSRIRQASTPNIHYIINTGLYIDNMFLRFK